MKTENHCNTDMNIVHYGSGCNVFTKGRLANLTNAITRFRTGTAVVRVQFQPLLISHYNCNNSVLIEKSEPRR